MNIRTILCLAASVFVINLTLSGNGYAAPPGPEGKYKVLLDLKLGAVNGVDVLKDIQAKYPGKPVVLMTGYREEMMNSIEKARKIGAYTCLYKPLEMDDLFRVIEEIRLKKLQSLLASA